jgi:hypothetical protein
LKRRVWLTLLVAAIGIAEITFAVQITNDESCSGDPCKGKLLVGAWLESEMWINPWVLLAGVSTLILAVVTFFMYPRLAHRREG